jgi:hypothetical protein
MIRPSRTSAILTVSLAAALLLAGCSSASPASSDSTDVSDEPQAPRQEAYTLQQAIPAIVNVTSTSLKATGFLLPEFTCEGTDISPHIAWDDVPEETQSIAVVAEDLDLAGAVASHWIVWGLSPDTRELPAGASGSAELPAGTVEGVNAHGQPGYKGPCPPPKVLYEAGRCLRSGFVSDPYRWSVYALEREVSLGPDATRDDLIQAIDGSVLASGSLDVKYISKTLVRKTRCGHLG